MNSRIKLLFVCFTAVQYAMLIQISDQSKTADIDYRQEDYNYQQLKCGDTL